MLGPAGLPPSRKLGVGVARVFVLLSSVHLCLVVAVIIYPEALAFEALAFEGKTVPFYYLAAATGFVYGAVRTPNWFKMSWLTFFTGACLSRGLTLIAFEVDYLTDFQQLAAAMSWILLWIGGILAALVLTANDILERD